MMYYVFVAIILGVIMALMYVLGGCAFCLIIYVFQKVLEKVDERKHDH
jgi:hypothetical protein